MMCSLLLSLYSLAIGYTKGMHVRRLCPGCDFSLGLSLLFTFFIFRFVVFCFLYFVIGSQLKINMMIDSYLELDGNP